MSFCAIPFEGFQGIRRQMDSWMSLKSFLLLLAIIALFSLFLGTHRIQALDYIKSVFLWPSQGEKLFGQDVRASRFRILMTGVSILVFSLFLSLFTEQAEVCTARDILFSDRWKPGGLLSLSGECFLKSLTVVLAYFTLKSLSICLYSRVHFPHKLTFVCQKQYVTHLQLLAVPLILVLGLNEAFAFSGITLFILFSVSWLLAECWSAVRLKRFFSLAGVSPFQFLLYLCALEILPLCVFCKAVFEWS